MTLFGVLPHILKVRNRVTTCQTHITHRHQQYLFDLVRLAIVIDNLTTVYLGSTNKLCLGATLYGGMMFLSVKNGSASYIVPGCMTLKPRRARYVSFWSSISWPKVQPARFGWEIGFSKFRDFFSATGERICTGPFDPSANAYELLGSKEMNQFPRTWPEKKIKKPKGEVHFSPIFVFWALLPKIQSAITPSIWGVRCSSLDSRELSTIPFNKTPIRTENLKIQKNISPGQTDSI